LVLVILFIEDLHNYMRKLIVHRGKRTMQREHHETPQYDYIA